MTALLKGMTREARAEMQAESRNYDKRLAEYRRAVEEEKMAGVLVSKGDKAGPYLEPFRQASAVAGRRVSAILNDYPAQLLNSCQDLGLIDNLSVARALQSVARADHARAAASLKKEQEALAIFQSEISRLIGAPAIVGENQPMPWTAGFIQKAYSAVQIALGKTTVSKWAISADRQSVAFGPSVTASNAEHYANGWHLALRDIKLAQASVDETARRLADAQAAFAEVKTAMIWSPV